VAVDTGRVVEIFEKAIDRALRPWTEGERRKVRELVQKTLRLLSEGRISREDAYYQLLGIANEYLVPLSPRDVSELKRILGVEGFVVG
jgi:uncharacterized protein YjiS (DUF1127 family)